MANGLFGGGNGTYQNPFIIDDAYDLIATQKYMISESYKGKFYHYKLSRDINLGVYPFNTGKGWAPLDVLYGSIDGNNHTIYNLYINRPDENNIGLFRKIDLYNNAYNTKTNSYDISAAVKNLSFENVNITGKQCVGTITGYTLENRTCSNNAYYNEAYKIYDYFFQNCKITGTISGEDYVGGVIGKIFGKTNTDYPSYNIRFMRNMLIDVNIKPQKAGQFFGAIFGAGASINPNYYSNIFENIVSNSTITNTINGKKDYNFLPMSFGYSTGSTSSKYMNGFINCYYNADLWCGINSKGIYYNSNPQNTEPVELTSAQIKNPNCVILSHELDTTSKENIWYFPIGDNVKRPELRSFITNYYYVKCDNEYFIYERGKWKKAFDKAPTSYEAMNNAMASVSNIPLTAWKELKDKNYTSVSIVMYKKYSEGTVKSISTNNLMQDYAEKNNENNKKKYIKKTFSFDSFGDNIICIEKGVAN